MFLYALHLAKNLYTRGALLPRIHYREKFTVIFSDCIHWVIHNFLSKQRIYLKFILSMPLMQCVERSIRLKVIEFERHIKTYFCYLYYVHCRHSCATGIMLHQGINHAFFVFEFHIYLVKCWGVYYRSSKNQCSNLSNLTTTHCSQFLRHYFTFDSGLTRVQ